MPSDDMGKSHWGELIIVLGARWARAEFSGWIRDVTSRRWQGRIWQTSSEQPAAGAPFLTITPPQAERGLLPDIYI